MTTTILVAVLGVIFYAGVRAEFVFQKPRPPKVIILMLGDDYGYHNVGFDHGPQEGGNPEMRTPNMDALARDGIVLDRFYTYKYCSPTRSSLMSGRIAPHVNQNNLNNDIQARSGPDLRMTLLPAKMKKAGYYTAMVGKSHLGARSPANLPINRGFDYHIGFLKGGEDHYTQGSGSQHGEHGTVDLWDGHSLSNETGIYSGYLYAQKAVNVIEKFVSLNDAGNSESNTSAGLFLYQAWHNTHTPLECPEEWRYPSWAPYNNSFGQRMTYNCMAQIMDDGIGNITTALKAAGLWDDTLLFFAADNGGWADNSGSNNFPLRGSKVSDFEGGVRVVSFLAGGKNVLPENVRGTRHTGLISIADWYGTLAYLVGVDPTDDVPGIPPVDSNNFWPSIMEPNANQSGRDELWLSWSCTDSDVTGCNSTSSSIYNTSGDPTAGQGTGDKAFISGHWKVVIGRQNGRGVWFGPAYPNGTDDGKDFSCVDGCLFDIWKDPTEHINLKDSKRNVWDMMLKKLTAAAQTLYQTQYGEPGADKCITGKQAAAYYVGHNTCPENSPDYNPSGPHCNETKLIPYLGPMCFKEIPHQILSV